MTMRCRESCLQRGEQSIPALKQLEQKVKDLNDGLLPPGMKLVTLYDRTNLIHLTTATVRDIVIVGLTLVTVILIVFLGDIPVSLIAALTIPCSLLFAFSLMVLGGQSANLISIGAIDFGILVDASVIVLENIYRRLQAADAGTNTAELIADATAEAVKPVAFSVLVIIVALIPLFTMEGVPGKIFAPMSETYGFALTGAFIFAILFAPVLASWLRPEKVRGHHTRLVDWLSRRYERSLSWTLEHRAVAMTIAGGSLVATLVGGMFLLGGEFMPKLEEGNLWVRATLPQDASYEIGAKMAHEFREILLTFPEVTQVVSQMGRPDDGTDVTTFNNVEFMVSLKNPGEWPHGISKDDLIRQMDDKLEKYPGIDFNFSQNIQDNVEEAMSGVKGENSLKLFGDDIDTLVQKADEMRDVMAGVPGVADLGVFQETGQPELLVSINRAASGRYGLMASDVDAAVQAAIGGIAATQILEGDRRFDFVIRYQPKYRTTPEAIRNILLPTPDGANVPLGQVADVLAARRRVHDLPREWKALHSDQIQRARARPCRHDRGPPGAAGGKSPFARGIPSGMGRGIRQPAEGAEAPGDYYSDQPADHSGAAVYGVQFAAARAAGADDSSVCDDRRRAVAADHAHAFQHFGGGGIRVGDRSVHAGKRGAGVRHPAKRNGSRFDDGSDQTRSDGGDASGDDGVCGGRIGIAARGGVDGDRRAGAATAGKSGGGGNGNVTICYFVSDSGAGELLAAARNEFGGVSGYGKGRVVGGLAR